MPDPADVVNPIQVVLRARDTLDQTTDTPALPLVVISDDPPTVAIQSPADGSEAVEGTILTLEASAADDIDLVSVEFLASGSLLPTTFEGGVLHADFQVPSGTDGDQIFVTARVTDTIGQQTTDEIALTLRDDLVGPAISIVAPNDGAVITVGPSDVALVLDTSGSTGASSGVDVDGDEVLDSILKAEVFAAKALLDLLERQAIVPNPDVTKVSVIDFSSGAFVEQVLTGDFAQVQLALDAILARGPGGGTNFTAAM